METKEKQGSLFDLGEWWEKDWQSMPEFVQNNEMPRRQLIINFATREDLIDFSKLIKQPVTFDTKSIWYPEIKAQKRIDIQYIDSNES